MTTNESPPSVEAGPARPLSPFIVHLDVQHEIRGEFAIATLTLREELLNVHGHGHGGVIATLVDTAASRAVRVKVGDEYALSTITMNVSYIGPAASWTLVAEGRCTRSGGIAFAEVEVKSGDGELVATGSVTFKTRRRTPP